MKSISLGSSFFLAAALLLGNVYNAGAQNDTTSRRNSGDAPMSAASFISKNIKDNKMEVEMVQMAIERSQNANVKAVAEALVRDHSDLLQQLSSLQGTDMQASDMPESGNTDSSNMSRSMPGDTGTASNQLDIAGTRTSKDLDTASNNNMMGGSADSSSPHNMLANASDEQFDSIWINQMLNKHKMKLGELHSARNNLSDPQLKTLVRNAIPVIRSHRDMLASLKSDPNKEVKMKGHGRDGRSSKDGGNRKKRNNRSDSTNQ